MYNKLVPRPEIAETYFANANAIDKHNRDAQDGIRTERVIKTGYWATRFNVSTLQKVAVDAWRGQALEQGGKTLHEFMSVLVDELLDNRMPGSERNRLGRHAKMGFTLPSTEAALWEVRAGDGQSDEEDPATTGVNLRGKRTSALAPDNSSSSDSDEQCGHCMQANTKIGVGALACCFCGALSCARFHCVQCSQDSDGEISSARQLRAFCGVGNERGCHGMELHCQTAGRSDLEAKQKRKAASTAERARKRARKARRAS